MSAPAVAYSQHDHDPLTLAVHHPPDTTLLVDGSDSLPSAPVPSGGNDAHPNQVRLFVSARTSSLDAHSRQLRVHISEPASSLSSLQVDADQNTLSRPASSSSSLDPYYFGAQSPSDSPAQEPTLPSITPETRTHNDSSSPLTPVRDPANIDRNGLVGVGELATPRWGRVMRRAQENPGDDDDNAVGVLQEEDSVEVVVPNIEPDGPDSPWTIEAVDGDLDDQAQVSFFFSTAGAFVDIRSSSVMSNR